MDTLTGQAPINQPKDLQEQMNELRAMMDNMERQNHAQLEIEKRKNDELMAELEELKVKSGIESSTQGVVRVGNSQFGVSVPTSRANELLTAIGELMTCGEHKAIDYPQGLLECESGEIVVVGGNNRVAVEEFTSHRNLNSSTILTKPESMSVSGLIFRRMSAIRNMKVKDLPDEKIMMQLEICNEVYYVTCGFKAARLLLSATWGKSKFILDAATIHGLMSANNTPRQVKERPTSKSAEVRHFDSYFSDLKQTLEPIMPNEVEQILKSGSQWGRDPYPSPASSEVDESDSFESQSYRAFNPEIVTNHRIDNIAKSINVGGTSVNFGRDMPAISEMHR